MNQIKYIRSAFLVIVLCLLCLDVIKTLFSVEIDQREPNSQIIHRVGVQTETKSIDSAANEYGKRLYDEHCISCHGSFSADDGPWLTLAGYPNRWSDRKELYAFVRDPEGVMRRNVYANALGVKFGLKMRGNPDLTDKEIENIFYYIDNEKAER